MGTKKGLGDLGKSLKKVRFEIKENAIEELKRAALLFDQQVVLATPVDTGRARSNWVVGINEPNRSIITEGFPKSTKDYTVEEKLRVNTITEGEANQVANKQLERSRAIINAAGQPNQIIISNNLPYINELNNGTSKQAPKNFVGIALKAVLSAMKTIKLIK